MSCGKAQLETRIRLGGGRGNVIGQVLNRADSRFVEDQKGAGDERTIERVDVSL